MPVRTLFDPNKLKNASVGLCGVWAYNLRWSSSSTPVIDGITIACLPTTKGLGFNAPRLDWCALTGVNRHELSACSTRQKVLLKTSSVRRFVSNTRLRLHASLSLIPSWCGSTSALSLYLMLLWARSAAILFMFHLIDINVELIFCNNEMAGVFCLKTNDSFHVAHDLAPMDGTNSRWSSQVFNQLKKNTHFF